MTIKEKIADIDRELKNLIELIRMTPLEYLEHINGNYKNQQRDMGNEG
jgi:hypothetical protein